MIKSQQSAINQPQSQHPRRRSIHQPESLLSRLIKKLLETMVPSKTLGINVALMNSRGISMRPVVMRSDWNANSKRTKSYFAA
jgi:hypothetical protein